MPAVSATVIVTVAVSTWASIGQVVFISNAGYFEVTAKPDSTHLTLENLGYTGNVAPATIVAGGQTVSPGGLIGPTGATPSDTLNDLSPTTTRGDLIVDNGANSPAASDVRLPVGTDGQLLTAQSAQPTGLLWSSVIPNASGSTDNVIPRFNTPVGTEEPAPLQVSGILITDTTAIQTIGGNARGTSSVDLQPVRGVATQVASGNNSTIAGGRNNTGSGADSAIGGGQSNIASNSNSTVGGGSANEATGNASTVGGGTTNVASAQTSTIGGGQGSTAAGLGSTVAGGTTNQISAAGVTSSIGGGNLNLIQEATATVGGGDSNTILSGGVHGTIPGGQYAQVNKHGQYARASGRFAANGDAQLSELIWRGSTANATPTEIFLDGSAIRATVPNNTTWAFSILATARRDNGVSVIFKVEGGIINTGGVVTLVAAITTTVVSDGSGGALVAGSFVVSADDPNNALIITVTGVAAQNYRWVAHAHLVELNF